MFNRYLYNKTKNIMENNLGKLNAIFMQNINNLFKRNDGPKIIKEFTSIIKNNKPLLNEYLVFECIENYNSENAKEYISECIKYTDNIDKNELKSLNEKLSSFMIENEIKQIDEIENEKLFENIHDLIFVKKSLKNINEKIEKINNIEKYIKENNSKNTSVSESKKYDIGDNFYQFTINKFNSKYSEKLNEEEKEIFKVITNAKNENEKISLFEEQKKECLKLTNNFLKEPIDSLTKEKLLNVKEKLLEQSYNKNTYLQDILSFTELKKTLL